MYLNRFIIFIVTLIFIAGCSSNAGRYYSTLHEGNYIDLNKDGTFMVFEDRRSASGKYEIHDDEIILKFNIGAEEKCIFKDGKIIDRQNEIYIKRMPLN
jgi:hypothetical protein